MYYTQKVFELNDMPYSLYFILIEWLEKQGITYTYLLEFVEYCPFADYIKYKENIKDKENIVWTDNEGTVYEKGDDLIGDWLVNNGASPFETILIKL